MKSNLKGVVAALAFFGLIPPALPDIVYINYAGTIVDGYDQTGIFGAPGASLAGDAYTTSYVFDTSIGTRSTNQFVDSDLGGIGYAQPSPSLGAVLTINGISVGISGVGAGDFHVVDFGDHSGTSTPLLSDTGYGFIRRVDNAMFDASHTIPISLDAPFNYSDPSGNAGHGEFIINVLNPNGGNLIYTWASLDPTSVTVTNPSFITYSVPEPSTWAMMLIGFAGLGFVIQRSRRRMCIANA